MIPRAFIALPLALALGACSNLKAASEANFKGAIQEHLASQRACLDVAGGFPLELVEGGFALAKADLLDELVSVGLLASEPIRKEVPKNAWAPVLPFSKGETKTLEGKRYSVTEHSNSGADT